MRARAAIALAGLAAALVAAAVPAPAAAADQVVEMSGRSYAPGRALVSIGDKVTWRNTDGTSHTVTSDDGLLDSGSLVPDESFSHRFTAAGSYRYLCSLHPFMMGSVEVAAATAARPDDAGPIAVHVKARLGRAGARLSVHATSHPRGAVAGLQLYSRERYAWRQVGHARLDRDGRASFKVRSGMRRRARVVVRRGGPDGPVLATSAPVRTYRARHRDDRRPPARHVPEHPQDAPATPDHGSAEHPADH